MAGRASGSGSSSAADRFARRVLAVVARIPPGRVSTYGDVAAMAGAPGAARAAGNVMATARIPGVPYHRVIAAGGLLGGYSDLRDQAGAAGRRGAGGDPDAGAPVRRGALARRRQATPPGGASP